MKYDFETLTNRANTGSSKWEQMKLWNPKVSEDVIPFSVADMELKNPPEVIEGLRSYLNTAILGYTLPTKSYLEAVAGWMNQRHNWEIHADWIIGSPGVVHAFFTVIRALTEPGDGVIVMTPVYYPFYAAIKRNNRTLIKNPLINIGSTYLIDFEDLEAKAKDPRNKILLFCSPHNPVGRVWTKEELTKVGEICLRNEVRIISDEIHFDLIMPGYQHTVFASLNEELANNVITCTAPSKTFNLAGLQTSNIIIPSKKIRILYRREVEAQGLSTLNILGYKACEIAYTQCEDWLDQFIELVYHNHLVLKAYIEENVPQIKVHVLEGTYLQWMDFRELNLHQNELEELMHSKAELFFDEGYIFGDEGIGFERMNIACPTNILVQALERLKAAIDELR